MKEKNCAVFSCLGLGDGLISLVLSNNLSKNSNKTVTFHPFLSSLQNWFPHLEIQKFPEEQEIKEQLKNFDQFFIFFEKSPWMSKIIHHCKTYYPDCTTIINPIATKRTNYEYWENAKFDGTQPFVDNLEIFCRRILQLSEPTKENGITPFPYLTKFKNKKRIIIHPSSSRAGKNWPQLKFIKLAKLLQKRGYDPCFILTEEEKKDWDYLPFNTPSFSSLSQIASFIYESRAMVGNDSGIGHLASCLGLPTITICRSKMASSFWRPSWAKGIVLTPSSFIPNIKGLRWRDKYWKNFISVSKVFGSLEKLLNLKIS